MESHRNGVGGAGFWMVNFTYDNEDLVGILYTTGDITEIGTKVDYHTCVINPLRPDACKRGYDYFGEWLFKEVKRHYVKHWAAKGIKI